MATFNIQVNKAGSEFIKDLMIFSDSVNTLPETQSDLLNLRYYRNIGNELEEINNEEVQIKTLVENGFKYFIFALPDIVFVNSVLDLGNLHEELIELYENKKNISVSIDGEITNYNLFVLEPDRSYKKDTNHLITIEKI